MKVLSTNTSKEPTHVEWQGETVKTGIYKTPIETPIYLGTEHVQNDEVSDRKVHGGIYKACYLFSAEHYPYWKKQYPDLSWNYGMLGENLTISEFDETEIYVGDIYKIGKALVQITQPREPCFKFGLKFGTQKVPKQFIDYGFPGTYVKVLIEGEVEVGDEMKLIERAENSLTVWQLFQLLYAKDKDQELLKLAVNNEALPLSKRNKLQAFLK